jgi:hypothetical protein
MSKSAFQEMKRQNEGAALERGISDCLRLDRTQLKRELIALKKTCGLQGSALKSCRLNPNHSLPPTITLPSPAWKRRDTTPYFDSGAGGLLQFTMAIDKTQFAGCLWNEPHIKIESLTQ